MNIFVLDESHEDIAKAHCDKHVSKMILESAQMLCTAHWAHGSEAPYKPVHAKHPCTLWAGESLANWLWLEDLVKALDEEFCWRYDRTVSHKSADVVSKMHPPKNIPDHLGLTKRPQCMPDEYKVEGDVIQAYRNYYIGEKHFAVWTKREAPSWYLEGTCLISKIAS